MVNNNRAVFNRTAVNCSHKRGEEEVEVEEVELR